MSDVRVDALTSGWTNLVFVFRRVSDRAYWNGSSWEAYNASNIATYAVAATEIGSAGSYYATNPDDTILTDVIATRRAGANLAVSDLPNAVATGSAGPGKVNTTQLAGQAVTAASGVTFPSTVAAPGDEMDLVDSPNATAVAAIQNGLPAAIRSEIDSNSTQLAAIVEDTGTTLPTAIGTPSDLGQGANLADMLVAIAGAGFSEVTDSLEANAAAIAQCESAVPAATIVAFTSAYGTEMSHLDADVTSRASQSSVDDLPTTAEFEARTLVAASYFDPSTDEVIVGTNNDKTGYVLEQAFPANFAALGINASGHIERVVLVDTTTENADMRGTDDALLAANYTTPPTVGEIDTELTAQHGSGSWTTPDVSGLSTFDPDSDPVANVTLVGTTTNLTNLPAIPNNWITAAGIASGAFTAAKFASGAFDAVLDSVVASHLTNGTLGKAIADLLTGVAAIPTTIRVKKNAALPGFQFPMVDSSDALVTGLTVTATRSIDGGAFGSCANMPAEIGTTGIYAIDLDAADLNGDTICLRFIGSGAKTLVLTVVTQP